MPAWFRLAAASLAIAVPAAADPAAAALDLLAAGHVAQAEAQLASLVARTPRDGAAWNALGLARHAQERWPDAVAAFRQASRLLPADPRVRVNLGSALLESGDLVPARAELEEAVRLDAAYGKAHLLLGRVAVLQGRAADAEAALRRSTELVPDEPVAWYHLGTLQLQQRRPQEAVVSLRRALDLSPDLPSAHLNLGLALRRSGDAAAAARHLERFRQLSDAQVRDAQARMRYSGALAEARKALEAGRPEAALAHAGEAISIAPDVAAAHSLRAEALARLGRAREAEAERREADRCTDAAASRR